MGKLRPVAAKHADAANADVERSKLTAPSEQRIVDVDHDRAVLCAQRPFDHRREKVERDRTSRKPPHCDRHDHSRDGQRHRHQLDDQSRGTAEHLRYPAASALVRQANARHMDVFSSLPIWDKSSRKQIGK
ncbi:MAG: hypothetical protein HY246_26005 [Proteobacteria bacterium]|nr:hypothetical protein [Pseudomonadota bacterium]